MQKAFNFAELPDNVQFVVSKADLFLVIQSLLDSKQATEPIVGAMPEKTTYAHQEAAAYLGVSSSKLYAMTSQGVIRFYKRGGKANFFKKADLDEWLFSNPQLSNDDIAAKADAFLTKQKKGGKGGK
jgi:excisionase family DNA binding protein